MEENIFSLKKEADNILSRVGAHSSPMEEMEKGARRLSEIGDRAIPFVANYLAKVKDPKSVERIMHLIELLNDCSYTPVLRDALLKRKLRDEPLRTKVEILATLKSYDVNYFDEFHNLVFDNHDDVFVLWVSRVLENFHDREYRVISLLEEILLGSADCTSVIQKIVSEFSVSAVPLLAILADCDNDEASSESLKCLGKLKDERTVLALKDIISYSWRKEVVEEAEKSLRKISFSGFNVQNCERTSLPPRSDDFKVFVSPVDFVGNVNLCISLKKTVKHAETMFIVINDEAGIVDIFGSRDMRNSDLDNMIDEVKNDTFLAERDLPYAIKLLNDALHKSEKNFLPLPPEFHYRKQFLSGFLKPESYRPLFKLSILRKARKAYHHKSYMEKSEELFERSEFKEWVLSTPRIFDYAEKLTLIRSKASSLVNLKEKELINSFSIEIINPLKKLIVERLFKMADFMFQSKDSPDSIEAALLSLATALKLSSRKNYPVIDIPFIRVMIEKNMDHCAEAIAEGFDLRGLNSELDELDD